METDPFPLSRKAAGRACCHPPEKGGILPCLRTTPPEKQQRHRQPGAGDRGVFLAFLATPSIPSIIPVPGPDPSQHKELGYDDAIRTAGFVPSSSASYRRAPGPFGLRAACVSRQGWWCVHPNPSIGMVRLDLRAAARLRRGRVSEGFAWRRYLVLFEGPSHLQPAGILAAAGLGVLPLAAWRRGEPRGRTEQAFLWGCWGPGGGQAPSCRLPVPQLAADLPAGQDPAPSPFYLTGVRVLRGPLALGRWGSCRRRSRLRARWGPIWCPPSPPSTPWPGGGAFGRVASRPGGGDHFPRPCWPPTGWPWCRCVQNEAAGCLLLFLLDRLARRGWSGGAWRWSTCPSTGLPLPAEFLRGTRPGGFGAPVHPQWWRWPPWRGSCRCSSGKESKRKPPAAPLRGAFWWFFVNS